MTLRVVGAGVGRTGTTSLKGALELLLGAPCYHMVEVFGRPDHIEMWQRAIDRDEAPSAALFTGYAAAVDWPAAAFYAELMAAHPDALVVLSTRDVDSWWRSASSTIFDLGPMTDRPELAPFRAMLLSLLGRRFTDRFTDEAAAKEAYSRHVARVRESVPADRLLEWQAGDGWEPLCAALGVEVPEVAFPHANTTAEFRAMAGLDGP
jgi:hypothetical protein